MLTSGVLQNHANSLEFNNQVKSTFKQDVESFENTSMTSERGMLEDLAGVCSVTSTESVKEEVTANIHKQLSQKKQSILAKVKPEDFASKVKRTVINKGPNFVRRIVSKGKRRFVQNGFDLDLAYVTDRIISTSFPATGTQALFRNSMNEFAAFMRMYHAENFRVYNLCSESKYHPSMLDSRVVRYPCDDMQPPSLEVLTQVVTDIQNFLEEDPEHIIAVHCKAGKGRTGVVVCAALLQMQICKTVHEALDLFAHRRTKNGKGVTISSQRRYIHYYNQLLNKTSPTQQEASWKGSNILSLKLVNIVKMIQQNANSSFSVEMFNRNIETKLQQRSIATILLPSVKELKAGGGQLMRDGYSFSRDGYDLVVEFESECGLELYGDVKVQLFKGFGKMQKSMFYLWFNVGLEAENPVLDFDNKHLDKCSKETKHYKVAVQVQTCPCVPAENSEASERSYQCIEEVVQQLQRESDIKLDSRTMSRSSSQQNVASLLRRYSRGHDSAVSMPANKTFNKNKQLKWNNAKIADEDNTSEATSEQIVEEIWNMFDEKWFHTL
eukprot:TRINITY_DN5384_c0_g1_i1.p1 TRINITY_DN5384_c0_g1~~TRINITY_DN5384_c0_g1_i1.p1  ORF type:complete len:553 (+),score=81.58 TRINITY_DN5384_c0_g1_i1:162-1820(+)